VRTRILRPLGLVLVSVAAIAAGCKSKSGGGTPDSVAQAFVRAIGSGDMAGAADRWNYVNDARKQNEDWDNIPSGQRGQIIAKLKESKQGELGAMRAYFGSRMRAEAAQITGATATVQVTGGPQGPVTLQLEQADGTWGVVAVTASVGAPQVPG